MLVLIYSSIDTLAWAVFGASTKNVGERFVKFCDEYLLTVENLKCTSLELYSARCSIVHNLGWESNLSTSGKARSIFYSFGTDNPSLAQEAYDKSYPGKFVAVRADDLLNAVESSVARLLSEAQVNPILRQRLNEAAGKQYMSLESKSSDELFAKVIANKGVT